MKFRPILFASAVLILILSCGKHDNTADNYGFLSEYGAYPFQGDQYNEIEENPFISVSEQPASTFSVDADGASYANVRRFLQQDNMFPPKDAVRTEELINYFELNYAYDNNAGSLSLNAELSSCPWNEENRLLRIGLKGRPFSADEVQHSNYVFLIDVSGSMASEDKLELLKNGFKNFTDQLTSNDRVAIVTYAGNAGVVLNSTSGAEKSTIKSAIDKLGAGGSTAGAAGITTAYEIAQQNLIAGGNNRIIIGTDGDFNVGPSSQEELVELIESKRDMGIYITVLGVGRGNLNDGSLERIANDGNGNYEYIDDIEQLRKVFLYDFNKFYTAAKDVKIQVNFNPESIESYRLIGYENRLMDNEDFEDEKKDAGEIGIDQNITALYELIPKTADRQAAADIDVKYKSAQNETQPPLHLKVENNELPFAESSDFMKFTASVAAFSQLLRNSTHKGTATYDEVLNWTSQLKLPDKHGYKEEFRELVKKAKSLE